MEHQLKFYKSYWYFNSKKTNIKGTFWVFKNRPFVVFNGFLKISDPLYFGGP
jgi:hypothetical protein